MNDPDPMLESFRQQAIHWQREYRKALKAEDWPRLREINRRNNQLYADFLKWRNHDALG